MPVDAISLEVFKNMFISVSEEMGVALQRTSYSTNMKERQDFSCALFSPAAEMVAQAAHQPVHLGAMPASVQAALETFPEGLQAGDIVILNDPYLGGSHLPDITLVAPVRLAGAGDVVAGGDGSNAGSADGNVAGNDGGAGSDGSVVNGDDDGSDGGAGGDGNSGDGGGALIGYVSNRGHHSDVGGMAPGSMPLSTELYQEGLIIPPLKLASAGRINREVVALICRNSRTPDDRQGDLAAQIASIRVGEKRLAEIARRYGLDDTQAHMDALLDYSERLTRRAIADIPDGVYRVTDYMDDDGQSEEPVPISVAVTVAGDGMTIDFTGTAAQRPGCINAPRAVTVSASLYVVRCVVGDEAPANQGCLRPVRIITEAGSLVDPRPQRGVAGGNVETSQRITDVLLAAMSQALPGRIPASSQGTMNNMIIGGHDISRDRPYVYYETIGGGMGARPEKDGVSGIHTHMTNTMNTPVEALEFAFPLRLRRYALRRGSGGDGLHRGGDGLVRDVEFLSPARVTVLSERRRLAPPGYHGGHHGEPGENILLRGGYEEVRLAGKETLDVNAGDVLSIRTPGGGGWGAPAGGDANDDAGGGDGHGHRH